MATPTSSAGVPITPPVRSSKQAMVIIFIFLAVIFFFAMLIIWLKSDPNDNQKKANDANSGIVVLPNEYTEYHSLKQGKIIRVNIPTGYISYCSSGGKKYYKQPQNGEKIIRGDGGNYNDGTGFAYFDLSFYEEEITVVVEFKKN